MSDTIVNEALFRPSEWDDYPLKRDDKYTNKIVQPDFAPFSSVSAQEPEMLHEGFQFVSLDVRDDNILADITKFLNENYYTGNGDTTPFLFESDHIRWVLDTPTNTFPRIDKIKGRCVVGVRAKNTLLVGLIAARPITYCIDGRVIYTLEVPWMCTHRDVKVRGKRLAIVLMKELCRRAYCWGVATGMLFCVPRQLPALFTMGPVRLLGLEFSPKTPPKPNKGIGLVRFANKRDVNKMMKLYKEYRQHWRLHREYNTREFEHTFLARDDVMTYVICKENGDIKDFVSLFKLTTGKRIAYVQFVSFLNDKLLELIMQNIVYIMYCNQFDAVYISDVNGVGGPLTKSLGFKEVDGVAPSFMYQFNYNTTTIPPNESQISNVI